MGNIKSLKKNKKNEMDSIKENKKNDIDPYCDINYIDIKGLGDFFIGLDDDEIEENQEVIDRHYMEAEEDEEEDMDINMYMDEDENDNDIDDEDIDEDMNMDEDENDNDIDDNDEGEKKRRRRNRKKKKDEECKYMIRNNEYSYAEACKRTLYWREKTQSWAGRKDGDIYDSREEAEAVLDRVSRLPNGKSGQCEERELKIIQVAADFAERRGAYYIEGRHHPCAKQKVRDRSRTIAKQKAWEDELTTYTPRFDPLDGSYIGE